MYVLVNLYTLTIDIEVKFVKPSCVYTDLHLMRSGTPIYNGIDIGDNGRVLRGPASCPPRQLILNRNGDWISIERLEQGGIA